MACCLTVPSHYQNNQCSYLICDGPWNLVENNSTVSLQVTILHSEFEKCTFKVTTIYPRGQWLDSEKKIIVIVHLPDTKTMTKHNSDVKMDADQRKHQSSASLPFVRGIHRWPVNSPHKRQVTRKFSIDDVIMMFLATITPITEHYYLSIPPVSATVYFKSTLLTFTRVVGVFAIEISLKRCCCSFSHL